MIGYQQLNDLEREVGEERADEIRRMMAFRQAISDDDVDSHEQAEAAEDLYAEAERLEVPHFMASARFIQATAHMRHQKPIEAVQAYLQLLQVTDRHGDLIHPDNVERTRGEVGIFVELMMDSPDVPLTTVRAVVAQVERLTREHGGSMADIHLANAIIASHLGDRVTTLAEMDAWQSAAGEYWSLANDGNTRIEIEIIERVDLPQAITREQQHLHRLDLDAEGREFHLMTLASLLAQAGRDADTRTVVDDALRARTEGAPFDVPLEEVLRALDAYPAEAQVQFDRIVSEVNLVPSAVRFVAALARTLLLRDPADADGLDLMRVADGYADLLDARNGTDAHRRRLAERWWTGLPTPPAPASREEAPEILERVILRRMREPVRGSDVPATIRLQYADGDWGGSVMEAPDDATAEALTARSLAEAERLRYPTGRASTLLMLSMYHYTSGDRSRGFEVLGEYQRFLLTDGALVAPEFVQPYAASFALLVAPPLASPDVPLERIRESIDLHERIMVDLDRSTYQAAVARAELAALLGDRDEMLRQHARMMELVGGSDAAPGSAELAICLTTARLDVDRAAAIVRLMPDGFEDTADADPLLQFTVLRAYLARRAGDGAAAARLAEDASASVDDDLEEIDDGTPLAMFVSAIDASPRFAEWTDRIETYARAELPGAWEVLPAIGGALLRRDPADPRGQALWSEGAAWAARLDARNGNAAASTQLEALWR